MLRSKCHSFEELPVILNMKEVADVLGISESSAYDLCRTDSFPSFRIGNRILIKRDKLVEWIDQQRKNN
jgi:excisionase family DNA binding protein